MPWKNRFDVKLTQDLFKDMFDKGHKLSLTLDVVNFGNLLNSEWGIQDQILSNGRSVLTRTGSVNANPTFQMLRDGNNLVTAPYRPVSSRFTTWSATFGMKYSF